jgi:hypothetical protein
MSPNAEYIVSEIDSNRYCKTNGQFTRHLRNNNITYQQYYEKYITGIIEKCPYCESSKKFYQKTHTYAATCCSKECISSELSSVYSRRPAEIKQIISKKKSAKWKSKTKDELDLKNQKTKATNLQKYGVSHHMKLQQVKDKIQCTNLSKYGAIHHMQNQAVKDSIRNNITKKYGVEHHMQVETIKNKVSLYAKNKVYGDKIIDLNVFKLKEIYENHGIVGLSEYFNITKCTAYRLLRENNIDLIKTDFSSLEMEIINYIKSIYNGLLIFNNRQILNGNEIDIYIPEFKLAIECNGTYWHSESNGRKENYHITKLEKCNELGIDFLTIWDYDWDTKRDIIKSIISSKLHKNFKIYARKCELVVIDNNTEIQFLEKNSLSGYSPSSKCIGLIHNNELVQVMSILEHEHSIDLIQICSKLGTNIVGGASKLFKYIKSINNSVIMSYSKKDIFNGNIYKKLGFSLSYSTSPICYYTKDYMVLDTYDNIMLNEVLNVLNNIEDHYDRVWDCGIDVWVYK